MTKNTSLIFIDDAGSGSTPVIFIHALAGNTRQWSAQLAHVRKSRRALAMDLRGHGQSHSPEDGDFSIVSMAQDILTAVDESGIERAVLVGHSLGGSVAGAFAGRYPERVAGLLLLDPSGDATQIPEDQAQQYLGALESEAYSGVIQGYWSQILSGSAEESETQVMQDLQTTSKGTVVGVFKELFNYNPVPALEAYDGPKLAVITSLNENPNSVHNLVQDLPHQVIKGTGHWLQMDKPENINGIMDDFLSSLEKFS